MGEFILFPQTVQGNRMDDDRHPGHPTRARFTGLLAKGARRSQADGRGNANQRFPIDLPI